MKKGDQVTVKENAQQIRSELQPGITEYKFYPRCANKVLTILEQDGYWGKGKKRVPLFRVEGAMLDVPNSQHLWFNINKILIPETALQLVSLN